MVVMEKMRSANKEGGLTASQYKTGESGQLGLSAVVSEKVCVGWRTTPAP